MYINYICLCIVIFDVIKVFDIYFLFFLVILIYGSDCSYCKEGGVSVVLLWGWCLGVGD